MSRISIVAIACACLALAVGPASADPARDSMNTGLRDYGEGRFEDASKAFEKAAEQAKQTRLDPAAAIYNQANTLMQMERPQDAASKYTDALRSTDLTLQKKAYFNRGNALYGMAESTRAAGDTDTALKALEEALAMYENAIALDPRDRDSKINYELTLKKQEEVRQQQQEQKQQQQQQQQEKQQNQDQQKDEKQEQQQSDQDKKQQQDKQDQEKQQEQKEQQQQQKNNDKAGAQDQQQQEKQPSKPERAEEMTPDEARVLLDAMRQEEQAARERYPVTRGEPSPVDKDW